MLIPACRRNLIPKSEAQYQNATYHLPQCHCFAQNGNRNQQLSKNTIKNTTKAIVEEVQKTGKSVDEVLNGDIISKIKDMYGDKY